MIYTTEEQDRIGAQWARAFMRSTGMTEVRILAEDMVDPRGEVSWHDDPITDERVFRFRMTAEVIDGEEVPFAVGELTMGGGA